MDVSAKIAVGAETKEIFLFTGAVYLQAGLGDFGLRSVCQWEREESRLYEGGIFFIVGYAR